MGEGRAEPRTAYAVLYDVNFYFSDLSSNFSHISNRSFL